MIPFPVRCLVAAAMAAASTGAAAALLPAPGGLAPTPSVEAQRAIQAARPLGSSPHWLAERLESVRVDSAIASEAHALSPPADVLLATSSVAGGTRILAAGGLWSDVRSVRGTVGPVELGGRGSPALWALLRMGQAQQRGDAFGALQGGLALAQTIGPDVAPVPLPGAVWFLLMGLLGWIGAGVTTSAKSPSTERSPWIGAPLRAASPASAS